MCLCIICFEQAIVSIVSNNMRLNTSLSNAGIYDSLYIVVREITNKLDLTHMKHVQYTVRCIHREQYVYMNWWL